MVQLKYQITFAGTMSLNKNARPKLRKISSDILLETLEKLNPIKIDSWQEQKFAYSFLRLGDRISVQPSYFLKTTNLETKQVRVIRIPAYIQSGQEAFNWATSVTS